MRTETVFDDYPWYKKHQNAADTIAKFMGQNLEQVLKDLDEKMNPPTQSEKLEASENEPNDLCVA